MSQSLVQAAVLLMGALTPLERADVNATFVEREPKPYEDFLPFRTTCSCKDCAERDGAS